jgi:eukaryotic translation initiation factor 2C
MITVACKPPNVNAAAIVGKGLEELGFKQGASPLNEFGVAIGTEMAVVPGRILTAPGIRYGEGTPSVDERASWNLRNVKFSVGGKLTNWAVLLIQDGNPRDEFAGTDDPELRTVTSGFANMCRTSGMVVDRNEPQYGAARLPRKDPNDPTRAASVQAIRGAILKFKPKPNLIMVILSNGDKHIYAGIKHLCDSYLDVATVCVHSSKIRKERGQLQYYANVALKVNMKMGGVNHALDSQSMSWLKKMPTMLVGMDVTHPGPGSSKGTPSVAAVVASIDSHYAQYPASMEIQETKKEVCLTVRSLWKDKLNKWPYR